MTFLRTILAGYMLLLNREEEHFNNFRTVFILKYLYLSSVSSVPQMLGMLNLMHS